MPVFHYKARTASGEMVEGHLEAPSAELVASQLAAGQFIPVRIEAVQVVQDPLEGLRKRFLPGPKVELDDLILFCRQMYTLTKSGVPIIRALRGLRETARKPAMGEALEEVIDSLESGQDLSTALGRQPRIFPLLLCSMVQVGENSGRLEEAFLQVSRYLALERETANQIKQALRYPTFVVAAISIAIGFLSLFVIPTFEKVFRSFGAELPLATRIILGISRFSVAYWPYIFIVTGLAIFLVARYVRTETGRYRWDRLKLRLPVVGSIIQRATLARFSRAFAMGFGAGVPLVHALALTARAVDNRFVGSKLEQMRNGIERGDTLTRTAAATGMFTPLVLQMLSVGEETGDIETLLQEVGEYYEREIEYDLKNLTSAIEPILIIFIGGMVLVLALGVFLPMWNLAGVAR